MFKIQNKKKPYNSYIQTLLQLVWSTKISNQGRAFQSFKEAQHCSARFSPLLIQLDVIHEWL